VLAIILPQKPGDLYEDDSQEKFWRGVSMAPTDVFSNLSHRFRELDLRLQKMEAFVTSREFEMDRELGKRSR
jgi:phage shock protein C